MSNNQQSCGTRCDVLNNKKNEKTNNKNYDLSIFLSLISFEI